MYLILLSGGSGKRLWPLSNASRSKQFLKVLKNEAGQLESMVQRVWHQIESVGLADSSYIATGKAQVEMIQSQLGMNVNIIVEPERRDTFPAIALSSTYLSSVKKADSQETVVILPVDPYVEDTYFDIIKTMDHQLTASQAELALIGAVPTYPSEKYGYIVPDDDGDQGYFKVKAFKEKPTEGQAKALTEVNAFWNCGVFAFKLGFMLNHLAKQGLPTQYHNLLKQYNELPKISFDYEVVEKTKKTIVIPYQGYWKDLGTWNTLTDEMAVTKMGKGIISDDAENTHLINELDIPITVLGLSNLIVAASPDGILVSDKKASVKVKDLVDFEQRPMYEERYWGWYKVLEYSKYDDGQEVLTKRVSLKAGRNLSYQFHHLRSEVWMIVRGEGEIVLEGQLRKVQSGDVIEIPAKRKHALKANTDLEFIEVQKGMELVESDIVRLILSWEEIERHLGKNTVSNE